jgi:hypothetical protein
MERHRRLGHMGKCPRGGCAICQQAHGTHRRVYSNPTPIYCPTPGHKIWADSAYWDTESRDGFKYISANNPKHEDLAGPNGAEWVREPSFRGRMGSFCKFLTTAHPPSPLWNLIQATVTQTTKPTATIPTANSSATDVVPATLPTAIASAGRAVASAALTTCLLPPPPPPPPSTALLPKRRCAVRRAGGGRPTAARARRPKAAAAAAQGRVSPAASGWAEDARGAH